jgi:hypothetical protein
MSVSFAAGLDRIFGGYGMRKFEEAFNHGLHGWARMKKKYIGRKKAQKAQKGMQREHDAIHSFFCAFCASLRPILFMTSLHPCPSV